MYLPKIPSILKVGNTVNEDLFFIIKLIFQTYLIYLWFG